MGILFWLAAMLILLVIEACTLGLLTIWFAIGAFAAAITALITDMCLVQWFVFIIISTMCLILIRPLLIDKVNLKKTKTNVETLAGKQVMVINEIDNFAGTGTVLLDGMEWSAVSENNKVIKKGTLVSVKQVRGVKLVVEESEEEN